jgi:hypothetical protein
VARVFSLDDDERPRRYPGFQQAGDLDPVRFVCSVELQDRGDGMAGPFLGLGVFAPAAGGALSRWLSIGAF